MMRLKPMNVGDRMRRYVHTTIKMSLAALITILITQALNLEYAITAGILAILFMQLTRRDSYTLAIKRIIDGLLAVGLSTLFFVIFGYNLWVFLLFTVIFIALSFALNISIGIVPSLVLASHLLLEYTFSFTMIINASAILLISAIVALLLNVLYPLNTYKYLEDFIVKIDTLLRDDLINLSNALNKPTQTKSAYKHHESTNEALKNLLNEAEMVDKDILFDKDHRHIAYLRMRHAQMDRIDRMYDLLKRITHNHPYTKTISAYVAALSEDIGHADKATPQLEKLHTMLETFRKKPLPDDRNAFETRAVLYQMMFEIETLLKEKIRFHRQYPHFTHNV